MVLVSRALVCVHPAELFSACNDWRVTLISSHLTDIINVKHAQYVGTASDSWA